MERPLVGATLLLSLLTTLGCQTAVTNPLDSPVRSTAPLSLQVPLTVERLAILYPKSYNLQFMAAYAQLAGAAFRLKESRPWLHIVERLDLPTVHGEQRFQLGGAVSDETAIGVGRLLGADSVLLYRIEGPTVRDRVLAKLYGELPPFTVTSKVIRVESAEVVYHNVVTAPVAPRNDFSPSFVSDSRYDLPFQAALHRSIARTIGDLQRAFQ